MPTHAERLKMRREAKKSIATPVHEVDESSDILTELRAIKILLAKINRREAIRSGEEM